jgi:hypothetical protein
MIARLRRWFSIAAGLLLILLLVVAVARRGRTPPDSPVWIFEVELRASSGTSAQLFWTTDGNFAEPQSVRKPIQPGTQPQTLRFTIPSGSRSLRFDPSDAAGNLVIGRMALRAVDGRVLSTFATEDLTSRHDVASIGRVGGETLITASGNDPWVILSVGCLSSERDSGSGWRFSAGSLLMSTIATLALLAGCFWAIGFDLFRAIKDGTVPFARWGWVWLPVVFLLVFAAKLLLMREFPLTAPYWDQWDGEARGLYLPYYNCSLSWPEMFALHNEHRIFFSRLLALDLLLVNGQWDPRFQQVVNAGLHSLIAVLLFAILWHGVAWRRLDLLALIIVPVFALPFGWENTLMGFQSAFYLLVLFSVLGLWLTTAFRVGSHAWWLGWLCALCSLFTVAGGAVLPAIIAGVAVLKVLNPPRQWRELVLTLGVAVGVLSVGVLAASPPLPGHEPLKATSVSAFLSAFLRNLAWPWIDHPLAGVFLWLPIAAFLASVVIRRRTTSTFERFVIGLASWALVQAAAIAYGRGGGVLVPAARYQDVLSLGFVANTIVIVSSARQIAAGRLGKGLATTMAIAWSVVAMAGLDTLTTSSLRTLTPWRPHWETQALNVQRFVLSGDGAELKSKPASDLPYPTADTLIDALRQPILRRLLPSSVRQPIRVQPRLVTNEAFAPSGAFPTTPNDPLRPGWGSFTTRGNLSVGQFESQDITACERGGYLSVPVAGYLGLPDLSLAVRSVRTGEMQEIKPARLAREDWVNVTIACPEGSFAIVGVDRNPDYWFAFREPVEIGRASVHVETLIGSSFRLMVGALAMVVVALKIT